MFCIISSLICQQDCQMKKLVHWQDFDWPGGRWGFHIGIIGLLAGGSALLLAWPGWWGPDGGV